MSDSGQPQRTIISAASAPKLPRHIKMRRDTARDCWLILAPERVFTPDAIAVATIAAELAQTYSAPRDRILSDIIPMLQELADKGVVTA